MSFMIVNAHGLLAYGLHLLAGRVRVRDERPAIQVQACKWPGTWPAAREGESLIDESKLTCAAD